MVGGDEQEPGAGGTPGDGDEAPAPEPASTAAQLRLGGERGSRPAGDQGDVVGDVGRERGQPDSEQDGIRHRRGDPTGGADDAGGHPGNDQRGAIEGGEHAYRYL